VNCNQVAVLIGAVDEAALAAVTEALEAGVAPELLLREGVIAGLARIGEKFEEEEYFLGELIEGGMLAEKCIALIDPHLPKSTAAPRGVVVIGAVQGDMHDLGYGLVAKQLELVGYEVHTMGVDVAPLEFIEKAREVGADVIGLSAFLVTTVPKCLEVVKYLRDMGLRERFKVVIGGGVTTGELAEEIGADGWAANAVEAVSLIENMLPQQGAAGAREQAVD